MFNPPRYDSSSYNSHRVNVSSSSVQSVRQPSIAGRLPTRPSSAEDAGPRAHVGVLPYRRPSAGVAVAAASGGQSWVAPHASPRVDRILLNTWQPPSRRPSTVSQGFELETPQQTYAGFQPTQGIFPTALGPESQGLWRSPSPFDTSTDIKTKGSRDNETSHVVHLGTYATMAGAQSQSTSEASPSVWRRRTMQLIMAATGALICVAAVALVVLAKKDKLHLTPKTQPHR